MSRINPELGSLNEEETQVSEESNKHRDGIMEFFLKYNTLLMLAVLVVASSLISPAFFTERNIFNLLRQVAALGIISMGMLLVILTSGIDLSVGSFYALGSVIIAYFLGSTSLPVSVILTLLVGFVLGSISGVLVSLAQMAPFVATLALMTIARGLAYIVSNGHPIITQSYGLSMFGNGYFLHVPLPVVLMLMIFIITTLILKHTVFGRLVVAIGSNEVAVKLAGIRVNIYKYAVYAISGVLSAMAGIISTARTGVGSPLVGVGMELDAIAAVVIGGASLNGGKGSSFNTLLGVLILGLIGNVMNLLSVPAYPQQVIKGFIIIGAVLMQGIYKK
ncbi:Ribose import permease protein RbsC [Moorella thermoacetica]|uniref:ABC transporter permease n=1 Tax=Neomoorella thermoacetica TaxID=1525 RepID=UPI00091741E2|nr:ABC transporter permease [Moorella thermoacetica]OIQ11079.1 ribose transport system permease protein RbsC [Moorella thermoacetica]